MVGADQRRKDCLDRERALVVETNVVLIRCLTKSVRLQGNGSQEGNSEGCFRALLS